MVCASVVFHFHTFADWIAAESTVLLFRLLAEVEFHRFFLMSDTFLVRRSKFACASLDNDHSDLMTSIASSGVMEPNKQCQALCFEVLTLMMLPGKLGLIPKSRQRTRGMMWWRSFALATNVPPYSVVKVLGS